MEILIDDIKVADGRLQRRYDVITVREDGGLYLGGVPQGLKVDDQAVTDVSLDGCLGDVVFNRE